TQMLSQFVDQNVRDASGALKSILKRRIKANGPTIDQHLDNPLNALIEIIQPILDKTAMLHEFVRQVDVRWGEIYQERPHFQQPGQTPHPDDEYTHSSVTRDLNDLLSRIEQQ
ncbi:hypothetical protein ACQZV8_20635, partial [Magnetococcales bacterium HHB-1]